MQIPPCRRDRGMSKSRLNQVNRRTTVECVGGMRVAEPVRRHRQSYTGAFRRRPDDTQDSDGLEKASVLCPLSGAEHGIARIWILRPQGEEKLPDRRRQLNRARHAPFAEDGDLTAFAVRLQIAPGEST